MFKIEDLYVEDRRLGDLFKAIAGIARGHPRPVPVANVEEDTRHTGLKAKTNSSNLVQHYADNLHKNKIETLKPVDVKEWLVREGYSALSYSYILKGLLKDKVLKRTGKATYTVQK